MKEYDIRPKEIFDQYLRLTEEDTRVYFEAAPREAIRCPACRHEGTHVFTKNGFSYAECAECLTLYVNPRPHRSAFNRYYTDSPSTKFWATTFYKETEAARREQIWKPKAALIHEKIGLFGGATDIIDIGGGYATFAEEIRRISDYRVTIVEPSQHLAEVCRKKGFRVVEKFLEETSDGELQGQKSCFVSFELFEHLYDPSGFLRVLRGHMTSDDLFIFTTLSGTGADIQVLWEHSKSVSPPHHLNFFNPQSVERLLKFCGFEIKEVSTPGRLDVDIIQNNSEYISDRFWKTFIRSASDRDKQDMQNYLAAHRMSSHMMVVCRRGERNEHHDQHG
jgi:hypothetical protein